MTAPRQQTSMVTGSQVLRPCRTGTTRALAPYLHVKLQVERTRCIQTSAAEFDSRSVSQKIEDLAQNASLAKLGSLDVRLRRGCRFVWLWHEELAVESFSRGGSATAQPGSYTKPGSHTFFCSAASALPAGVANLCTSRRCTAGSRDCHLIARTASCMVARPSSLHGA